MLILETGTGGKNFKTHVNDVEFTFKNWIEPFSNENYWKIPLQVRKLIQVGKKHREVSVSNNSKQNALEQTQHQQNQEQQDQQVALALREEVQGPAENSQAKFTAIVEYVSDKIVGAGNSFGGK